VFWPILSSIEGRCSQPLALLLCSQAMEAGFSTATALGKKYWFQDSKEDMKIKIAWSNKICEQMQSMLQD